MITEYYVPEWILKRAAKQLSRQIDITHVGALNQLAFELGFQDWAEFKHKGYYFQTDQDPTEWISEVTDKIAAMVEAELAGAGELRDLYRAI